MQHPWLRSQGVAADKPLDSVVLHRMRKLSATNKLKKAALVVMAKSLSPDEINGLQQLFRNIDADNSGTITIDELRTALTSCNGKMSVCNRPGPCSRQSVQLAHAHHLGVKSAYAMQSLLSAHALIHSLSILRQS